MEVNLNKEKSENNQDIQIFTKTSKTKIIKLLDEDKYKD